MEDTSRSLPLLLILLFCTCGPASLSAQTPDRELRGVWMATVLNIDYPQNPTPSSVTLKADFNSQLYRLRQAGINTIYLQVRSAGDALYPSAFAPWSAYVTGKQGKAPNNNFDPLAYAIKAAHAHGVEVHAWVNPYRVSMSLDPSLFSADHLFYQHRDWVHAYGNRMYLDPGLPEVRTHLGAVIDELVSKYDLDGLHFDDYFYPYPRANESFPDSLTFSRYGGSQQLGDWRRSNVNTFVAETQHRIKAVKPWVQFGISPFGVWRNQSQDPVRGSATRASVSSYDDLYGDALAWASNGTVDYLLPQLYWSMEFAPAGHRVLTEWWAKHTPPGVDLFTGHAAYKVNDNAADSTWNDPAEIPRQIALARQTPQVKGSVYFSAKSVLQGPYSLRQSLAQAYQTPVLLPIRKAPAAAVPVKLKLKKPKKTEAGKLLIWDVDKKVLADDLPHYYAIYRSSGSGAFRLIHRTPYGQDCHRYNFLDAFPIAEEKFKYKVVPMDRWHREMVEVTVK